ncbi:MAG TPA: branched-chain amino acid ABC transporter permease [Ktedonobacterales bacterium]|nr:branched-chain amino acid ABC transporter permease [Ktedonobacterales bacterium]
MSEVAASPATSTPAAPTSRAAIVRWALPVVGVVVAVLFYLFGGDRWLSVANFTMIYAIAALGLNVLSGYAGQVSLGIAFFMAIGGEVAAWMGSVPTTGTFGHAGLNLPFYIWLPAAGLAAAAAGALIGPTALRLRGFYLGIVSLALIFLGQHLVLNVAQLQPYTGGPAGRSVAGPMLGGFDFNNPTDIAGVTISREQAFFVLILLVLVITAVFVRNVARSRIGRAFEAVRDNEVAAVIMGVNLFTAKMAAFVFSSFLAGIAGALLASYSEYIRLSTDQTQQWGLVFSIQFVAAIIIGGVASVWGSILGAAFVFALPTLIDKFSLVPQSTTNPNPLLSNLNTIIYGLLIVVFLLFEPGGVVGLIRRVQLLARRVSQPSGKGEARIS